MAFTTAQLVDLRRFLGYSMYGAAPTPMNGYRFFVEYGTMEYRLANMLPEEEAVVTTTYLANLYTLETGIVGAAANLDTDSAAVWKHNKNEVAERTALFNQWRKRLADFIGLPLGDGLGSSNSVSLVV